MRVAGAELQETAKNRVIKMRKRDAEFINKIQWTEKHLAVYEILLKLIKYID